jgi:hypothetical protein
MKSFRAHWDEAGPATRPAPHLRVVPRVSPPRPRWRVLYAALGTIVALGAGAHMMIHDASLIVVADTVFSLALFGALAGWVHANRVALSRLDEPDADHGRLRVRIVGPGRGRHAGDAAETDGRIVRLDPDDRVILPYDFR